MVNNIVTFPRPLSYGTEKQNKWFQSRILPVKVSSRLRNFHLKYVSNQECGEH